MPQRQLKQLTHQAIARFILISLVITLLCGAVLWGVWRVSDDRMRTSYAFELSRSLQNKFDQQMAEWARVADLLGATISFQQFLQEPGSRRWAVLRTYLNSMEDAFVFDDLVVVDKDNRPLFRFATGGPEIPVIEPTQRATWVTDAAEKHAYRVMRSPVWLGAEDGQGAILAYRAVENQELDVFSATNMQLQLLLSGRRIASSTDFGSASPSPECHSGRVIDQAGDYMCAEIGTGMPNLRLMALESTHQLVSPQSFVLAGLLFVVTLGLALYVVLGRWLGRFVRRVSSLGKATTQFDDTRQLSPDIRRHLSHATEQRDVIGMVGQSLERLMVSSVHREAESRAYLSTLEILQEAVVEIDMHGHLLRSSPAWAVLVGKNRRFDSIYDYFESEDAESMRAGLRTLFEGSKNIVNIRLRTPVEKDQHYWLESRFVAVDWPVTRVRGVLRDITQTYLHERQITHMALHDALTGLPNRTLLEDRIQMALGNAQRDKHKVGFGFIDVDNFKNVNDVLGHKAGDKLLLIIAKRLQAALRTTDTVARWGGDEFVILLSDVISIGHVRQVAEKLMISCQEEIIMEGHNLPFTFSMGFSIYPDDGDNMETLLSHADRAMFYAKTQGRNNTQFYGEMAENGVGKKELYIQAKLVGAINNAGIEAWFQPLVNSITGKVVGMEALARWHDSDYGWIPPETFISMAENMGMIRELGEQIIEQALDMHAALAEMGHKFTTSINVSKRQLYFPEFEESLALKVERLGIDPGRIMLEITESIAMSEVAFSFQRLHAIHQAGFHIAIDDFGVGYSSLSQLHDMPLNELKIDMSFTRLLHTTHGARMVQAIVAIAESLGILVVAEGVESAEAADQLREYGVPILQGYFCGKPMPADEFKRWLLLNTEGELMLT